jgi:hypothetical protein
MQKYHLSGPTVLNEKFMIKMWREITNFFHVQKIKIWLLFPVKKYIAVGGMIVFCVVFCWSVIAIFLLAIVLPVLALGDLKTLLALFLKQKRVRKFTWLDTIQCEKIRVQFSIGFNLVWKLVCNFMSLDNKWSKKNSWTILRH